MIAPAKKSVFDTLIITSHLYALEKDNSGNADGLKACLHTEIGALTNPTYI